MSDVAVPPGDTLEEVLSDKDMTQWDLASHLGIGELAVDRIIKGDAPITPEIAANLDRIFDIDASFWNNLEKNFRDDLAQGKPLISEAFNGTN